MVHATMLFLLIILANLHGFIIFIANLTFSPFFPSFRHMSNAFLTIKLNPSKPMVVVNIKNYATYLPPMASIVASHAPHTHEQNGFVERKHRHIVEMGLTLLAHSSAPLHYWAEAFQTACYLINRLPTPVLNHESPFQKLFNSRPNYTFLHVFGCACWPHLRPYNKHKLDF
jgi:hypothetical protein